MHLLYWRIFLGFWVALALILVGTVTVAVNATAHRTERPWVQRAQLYAQAAQAFEREGPAALERWVRSQPPELFNRTFVVGPQDHELLNRPLPSTLNAVPGVRGAGAFAPLGGSLVLLAPGGATYHVLIAPVREAPRLFGELELPGVPFAILFIALGVSTAVCLALARYLAAPVDRLRLATRQLAGGDLNVQGLKALARRKDDLGLLALDLDTMAERLRQLLDAKQQLLRDVSHELRSPLARLQLALSLARREEGPAARHLERIASEADRLEQLIARALELVRLERPGPLLAAQPVAIAPLLRAIAAEVAIEAEARGCRVQVLAAEELAVCGDGELLRSAFENVLRNAVRFSPPAGEISVTAQGGDAGAREVQVRIRDEGPGVPEPELALIFEPFYRVDTARGHQSQGGEGLGLAIAARAIAAHGGQISAANAADGGLVVAISLPADARAPAVSREAAAAA
ncbi:MAG: HAMP domain-containing protein [Gammaproteobacteria bacterium]|nr:HAMP domain-containing protein [Gammaproteobacteria bacterium]